MIELLHNFIGELHKLEFSDLITYNKTDYNNPLFFFSILFPNCMKLIHLFTLYVYAHS